MPTGYTAKLVEHGQSFEEFVWTCARAFGALIMMRDDALDAPIPQAFKPEDYHNEAIERHKEELRRFNRMSDAKLRAMGKTELDKLVKDAREGIARNKEEDSRIDAMAALVRKWEPPTEEHQELKKFMLQQLDVSRHGDSGYWENQIKQYAEMDPLEFMRNRIAKIPDEIAYHVKEYAAEIDRTSSRNAWLRQLRESVPMP